MSELEKPERAPAMGLWLQTQPANPDPIRAAAAIHIRGRWDLNNWYNHSKTLRVLENEQSEFLVGARLLTDDYFRLYGELIAEEHKLDLKMLPASHYPFSPELCENVGPGNKRCTREAVPGTGACARHGGQWLTEEDRKHASVFIADRLHMLGEKAVRVLDDLLDNAKSEKVRLDAAVAILDRTGHGPDATLTLKTEGQTSPSQVLTERLALLGDRVRSEIEQDARAELPASEDGIQGEEQLPFDDDVVDAEVIEVGEPSGE